MASDNRTVLKAAIDGFLRGLSMGLGGLGPAGVRRRLRRRRARPLPTIQEAIAGDWDRILDDFERAARRVTLRVDADR